MLPLSHVSTKWRRAALGDSSLWTTIYLNQTTAELFDMVLARSGNRLFTVYVDHHDFNRFAKLWKLVDRIEELHYSAGLRELPRFLSFLGSAPNLKILHLRPEFNIELEELVPLMFLPTIFSGCLPSLRHLALTYTIAWPDGLFRGLTSFECGVLDHYPISPPLVIDALRGSPSLEVLRLVGCGRLPRGFNPPVVALPSLGKCTLVGDGTTSLIRFITIPTTAVVLLSKSYATSKSYANDSGSIFPNFRRHSVKPALRVLGEISAVSFSINDQAVRLRARNDRGGDLDIVVDGLDNLPADPLNFVQFIQDSFACWRTCSGLETTKDLTLSIESGRILEPRDTTYDGLGLIELVSILPDIEEAKFHGFPPQDLSLILRFLSCTPKMKLQCPNLKRLDVESALLRSPGLLLAHIGELLEAREEVGVPLQSVAVKVKYEELNPVVDHRDLLSTWESLVAGDVRLELEQIEVERAAAEGEGGGVVDDSGRDYE